MTRLSQELSFFDQNRQQWIASGHLGKWVVVHGEALHGVFDSLEEAFRNGAKHFGSQDFLVKEVVAQDRVEKIQRANWGTVG